LPMKILVLLLTLCYSTASAQVVTKIVDGDTFKAAWNGDTVTVRLCGVDTPESKKNAKAKKDAARSGQDVVLITSMGKKSTEHLKSLLPIGTKVRFEFDVRDKDRYGRLLAYVYRDKIFINERLLQDGMATTMTIAPNVKYAERFREVEADARVKKVGHWK